MDVCARLGAVVSDCPFLCIEGFGEAEIKRQLGKGLPAKDEVRAATETVGGRDGEGIKDVVLVEVNAIRPFASVKGLKAEAQSYWVLEIVGDILRKAYSVTLHEIGIRGGAERPGTARPIELGTGGVGGTAFLFRTSAQT